MASFSSLYISEQHDENPFSNILVDHLQILKGSFSAVSKPILATKYSLESSRRDLQEALLRTAWNPKLCNLNIGFKH